MLHLVEVSQTGSERRGGHQEKQEPGAAPRWEAGTLGKTEGDGGR